MNLTQLKYFQAVCSFRSVSAAAEYLHISQPTLSASVKELENEFGVSLFLRHHKGVTLTVEGEVLYALSRDILDRATYVENKMKELGSGRKTLKLGMPPMIGSMLLSNIYHDFLPQNPDISIEIFEGGYSELTQKLDEGYLDVAVVPHDDTLPSNLSAILLSTSEIVCCVHKDNPIANYPFVRPELLTDAPIVLFENSFFQTAKIKKWFQDGGISPNILLQTEQLSTMFNMVSDNLAVGFMLPHVMDVYPDIVTVPLGTPIQLNISLAYQKNTQRSNGMERFMRYMKEQSLK